MVLHNLPCGLRCGQRAVTGACLLQCRSIGRQRMARQSTDCWPDPFLRAMRFFFFAPKGDPAVKGEKPFCQGNSARCSSEREPAAHYGARHQGGYGTGHTAHDEHLMSGAASGRSGSGPHSPAVGRGFQDHLVFRFQPRLANVFEGRGAHTVVAECSSFFPAGSTTCPTIRCLWRSMPT